MPKFICITKCVLNQKTSDGKPYPKSFKPGQIFEGKEAPNHHFVKMDEDNQGKDPWAIIADKLKNEYGAYVDDEMTLNDLQKILAEKRAEDMTKDEVQIARDFLDKYKIRYHHKTGINKLISLIQEHGLYDDYMKSRKET